MPLVQSTRVLESKFSFRKSTWRVQTNSLEACGGGRNRSMQSRARYGARRVCIFGDSVSWQGPTRRFVAGRSAWQTTFNTGVERGAGSDLNWRSRVRLALSAARSLRNFVTAEYFQPRRSRRSRGESIKGKSLSFTSAVPRRSTFSFSFPFGSSP